MGWSRYPIIYVPKEDLIFRTILPILLPINYKTPKNFDEIEFYLDLKTLLNAK